MRRSRSVSAPLSTGQAPIPSVVDGPQEENTAESLPTSLQAQANAIPIHTGQEETPPVADHVPSFKATALSFFATLKQRISHNNTEDIIRSVTDMLLPMMIGMGISLIASGAGIPLGITMLAISLTLFIILRVTKKPENSSHTESTTSLQKEQERIHLCNTSVLLNAQNIPTDIDHPEGE